MQLHTPNTLSDKQIKEFQEITQRLYGISLSKNEAEKEGIELIEFIATIIEDDS